MDKKCPVCGEEVYEGALAVLRDNDLKRVEGPCNDCVNRGLMWAAKQSLAGAQLQEGVKDGNVIPPEPINLNG